MIDRTQTEERESGKAEEDVEYLFKMFWESENETWSSPLSVRSTIESKSLPVIELRPVNLCRSIDCYIDNTPGLTRL